ncbi:MAG: TIGR03936 family radical SAM-associated protein [Candidatus Limnocylindrales bacterium]
MNPDLDPARARREASLPAASATPPAEPRQRWRVTYRRGPDAPALPQREQLAAWEAAISASGLPAVGLDHPKPRPRLVFAAPLAVGMVAERERLDLFLARRCTIADVRERLESVMPTGHHLVALEDAWLGEPPLTGQVVAADYRVRLAPGIDATAGRAVVLHRAAAALIAAMTLPRTRDKGGKAISYDLRPLVSDIQVLGDPPELGIRTRFDPERGTGRPEEVVAALGDAAGVSLEIESIVRERLVLARET